MQRDPLLYELCAMLSATFLMLVVNVQWISVKFISQGVYIYSRNSIAPPLFEHGPFFLSMKSPYLTFIPFVVFVAAQIPAVRRGLGLAA
ncbi:hypothetical protein DFJ73DRAFT_193193 [Zopfochytrium polystomum]|nr:hypothetical protein DFJ73DRAFT_193193 [Zopfochytrium polystomum]